MTPRILHCIPTLLTGGAERQLRQLLPPLAQAGCECALFTRFADGDRRFLENAGVACFDVPRANNYSIQNFASLFGVIRRWRPNLIQTWITQMDVLGGMAALMADVPLIISERSAPERYRGRLKARLRGWIGSRAAAIVANSRNGTAVWPHHGNVHVIANGIDLASIACAEPPNPSGIVPTGDGCLAISACRLDAGKDVRTVISAMCILGQRGTKAVYAVLGDGEKKLELDRQIRAAQLTQSVFLLGTRKNIWGWLKLSSVFVSSSRFEGQPNAVLEAAAARVPLVLSDIPAHRELFTESDAVFVPAGDARGFADAIQRLITDRSLAQRLAEQAFEKVRSMEIATSALRYKALYEQVLSR